ncbi:MAG: hypothetical protein Q8O94_03055 [bacterium]|nr:hypothetical protein [bacterium]
MKITNRPTISFTANELIAAFFDHKSDIHSAISEAARAAGLTAVDFVEKVMLMNISPKSDALDSKRTTKNG